jgi:DNA (cytosine-5)-methyltransferase 1
VSRTPSPRAIDLFCGTGGLTAGLKMAGFRVIAGLDIDELAIKSYKRNHPEVSVWTKSASEVSPQEMMCTLNIAQGELDLLAGCPPCQAFSSMPRRNGGKSVRDRDMKDLALRFVDYVEAMKPKAIMMENVPGLVSDVRMASIKKRLKALGYIGNPKVLNAADYGVPQRRRRMVFVASRIGKIADARPIKQGKYCVRSAIGKLPKPEKSTDPLHANTAMHTPKVMALIRAIPKNGGSREDLGRSRQLKCHKACDGFHDVYGRMSWKDVAPTITGGFVNPSKGRFLHPQQDRAITIREAALLQGFPSNYWFPLEKGKYAAAQLVGNAFPPPFAAAHGKMIAVVIAAHHKYQSDETNKGNAQRKRKTGN